MEKKNIDWSSLGFGYVKTDSASSPITRTAPGTQAA